jgi:hypothetical protein
MSNIVNVKNNKEELNNNISFLYNNEAEETNLKNNSVSSSKDKKKKNNTNKVGENKNNGFQKYVSNQQSLISNEALSTIIISSGLFKNINDSWYSTPFQIKIGYIFILGSILYYFLMIKYNLYGSIISGLLLFILLLLINFYLGIIFLIILLIMIYNKYNEKIKISGTLIKATEIKNNKPYNGMKNHEFIESKIFPKEINTGLFGYSFWLYINKPFDKNPLYRNNEWKSIFYRGTQLDQKNDISQLTQYLGVWLTPNNESLAFVFQQNGSQTESIELTNINFNIWTHYYIGVSPKSINIYKNGKLEVSSSIQQSSISMNDYGLFITSDYALSQMNDISQSVVSEEDIAYNDKTGFDGYLSYLTYYQYPLSPNEISDSINIYKDKINSYENNRKNKIEDIDVKPIDMNIKF